MHPYIVHCILVYVHIRDQFLWDNVLCNCIVVATVIVIHIMMYCDVTSGFCTYIYCVPVDVNHGLKYKYYSSLQNKMYGISYSTCYISPMSFSTYIHSLQGHAPDSDNDGALVSCFDLFLRLMREDK